MEEKLYCGFTDRAADCRAARDAKLFTAQSICTLDTYRHVLHVYSCVALLVLRFGEHSGQYIEIFCVMERFVVRRR